MAKFKPSAKLSFGAIERYNPQYLMNNYTPSEIRREYSRVRAIAVKRLTRLAKGGFGQTSVYKYNVYNTKKLSELTEKQIKDALKGITTDEVYGLELSETGELVMDKKNFFTTNMMKKIHTNTLIPMVEEDCLANLFYIVIGTHKEKGNTMYDVISSRYERTSFTEEKVKTLLDMHIISAGAKLENGAVVVASLEKPTALVADGKQKEDKEKSDTL